MEFIKTSRYRKLETLRNNIYFEGLEESVMENIAENMSLYDFERKETIFLEEEESTGLHIMESGSAKIYRLSPQGRQYIVKILIEGNTFNEVSVFDGGGNPVNTAALEDSKIWIIKSDALRKLAETDPVYAQKIIKILSGNLRSMVQKISGMAFYQVTHRLARLLSRLPEESLSGDKRARITQNQLAALLGSVREVVARSVKELERGGAISVYKRKIYIEDRDILEKISQGTWE
ncbi:MAG: Crp/Fnr family transcriptional regulator [Anaerolineae bacterium]|jgi:CRP-like cAMP-binding protein|nr:Crp/Fnr family transcriptional regulator [Anaerolineae bacterium]MBT7075271.1 Crp/Fnr family transcriptional regulator [Anaerolineae bacterium]MBT7783215.1 Crp/Fnr family transcriptional regulator [Anaerolineae bacterium]